MQKAIVAFFVLAVLAAPLGAQTSNEYRSQGTVFFAPGSSSLGGGTNLHVGVGGLGRIYKGLGAGADIGYVFPAQCGACGAGILSANAYYHFTNVGSGKLVPFVTAGFETDAGLK